MCNFGKKQETMTQYKHIVFDFDGTIADTIDLAVEMFNNIAHEYKMEPLNTEDQELIRRNRPQELLKTFGLNKMKLTTLMLRLRKEMVHAIPKMKMIDGMKEALTQMKEAGYKMGILTSNSVENVSEFLKINEVADIFDFIYSGKNLFGKAKVINKMLKQEGISKEQVVYVGDETRDVDASHKANIPVIAVNWGLNNSDILEKAKPDKIAEHPEQLIGYVGQIID